MMLSPALLRLLGDLVQACDRAGVPVAVCGEMASQPLMAFALIGLGVRSLSVAGRTDAGVHAIGQVIHFDTHAVRTPRAWVLGANTRLTPSIALQWAGEVSMGFHARHNASRRIYRYLILNRSARSALQRARAAWIHRPLDAQAMHAAAQALIGEHDFSAFRSIECQSQTPIRRVDAIEVTRAGDLVSLQIVANAYLHHMVRNIVGTLLDVQRKADPQAAMAQVLASADRRYAGATAPAEGLYLWRGEYPKDFAIPAPRSLSEYSA